MKYSFFKKIIAVSFGVCMMYPFFITREAVAAPTRVEIYGWAWSDTTGWVKLNSCNDYDSVTKTSIGCSGPRYAVALNPITNKLSGYAWSSNLGWISFNSGNTCNGSSPTLTPIIPAGIITKYTLSGAVQVTSLSNPLTLWGSPTSSGGWDGCIYLSSSSMSENPCKVNFGVEFVYSGLTNSRDSLFKGTGAAWGAGGSKESSELCTNAGNILHAWGGVSWLRFDGIFPAAKAKFVIENLDPKIITFVEKTHNPACTDASTVELSWTTEDANICWISYDHVNNQTNQVTVATSGSQNFPIGRSDGRNFILRCRNNQTTTIAEKVLLAGVCSQCTDNLDNDSDTTIDTDDVSCYQDLDKANTFLPLNRESGSCQTTDPRGANYCGVCKVTDPNYPKCVGTCKVGDPGYPNCSNCKIGDPGYPNCPITTITPCQNTDSTKPLYCPKKCTESGIVCPLCQNTDPDQTTPPYCPVSTSIRGVPIIKEN